MHLKNNGCGTSLVVQRLNTRGSGLIPSQGTRSHLLQLKILHPTIKNQCSTTPHPRPQSRLVLPACSHPKERKKRKGAEESQEQIEGKRKSSGLDIFGAGVGRRTGARLLDFTSPPLFASLSPPSLYSIFQKRQQKGTETSI